MAQSPDFLMCDTELQIPYTRSHNRRCKWSSDLLSKRNLQNGTHKHTCVRVLDSTHTHRERQTDRESDRGRELCVREGEAQKEGHRKTVYLCETQRPGQGEATEEGQGARETERDREGATGGEGRWTAGEKTKEGGERKGSPGPAAGSGPGSTKLRWAGGAAWPLARLAAMAAASSGSSSNEAGAKSLAPALPPEAAQGLSGTNPGTVRTDIYALALYSF
jgi:hypothetical protein